nr:ribosomal protein L33 [Ipomoea trifida]GLL25345.1 ribosomal protein L33 [Ipomoea trifida]GLL39794.1 ribosomal protein L33 [Ipomoea trifida]
MAKSKDARVTVILECTSCVRNGVNKIVYEFTITIGYSSFANYCVYPSDPQPTKISLLPIPIPMS